MVQLTTELRAFYIVEGIKGYFVLVSERPSHPGERGVLGCALSNDPDLDVVVSLPYMLFDWSTFDNIFNAVEYSEQLNNLLGSKFIEIK